MSVRQAHWRVFGALARPTVAVTTRVNCVDIRPAARHAGIPVSAALLWALATACRKVEAFCWRLGDGLARPARALTVSSTAVGEDGHLRFVYTDYAECLFAFAKQYERAQSHAVSHALSVACPDRDHIYTTIIPWIDFTAMEHPGAAGDAASTPNFAIGKFCDGGDELEFPFSVQAHHALVDGSHIALLLKAFEIEVKAANAALRASITGIAPSNCDG